jgi:transglutaminase-like putative cysteine protease
MILHATHTTTYTYSEAVSLCNSEVFLTPRATRIQKVLDHTLVIHPATDCRVPGRDYFGNEVTYFSIDEPHQQLSITANSVVEMGDSEPIHPGLTPPWEQVREVVRRAESADSFDALQFIFESPRVAAVPEIAPFAAACFPPGRPLLEATLHLCRRINGEFKYRQGATTIATSVDQVLKSRQGVCQDFSHVMIACLRSLGLPARYVSGYLRSRPGAAGAQASHAWVSAFCPGFGWFDFDPTNNVMPHGDHVTIAWGRDYSDVPPVKGVALGGGKQVIEVAVEVRTRSESRAG